jgi:tRNA threonylcarbamoyladenosine biosynthesis protein TsaE
LSLVDLHPPIVKTIGLPDEQATQILAVKLTASQALQHAVIELHGNLGAGKTTLTRYLLRALGVSGHIKSPTYAVVESYESSLPGFLIWHFDFYRFNDPNEWEDAGFRDIFAGPGLKLMEWPDKVAGQLPPPDWVIALDAIDENQRQVRISTGTERGRMWLQAWMQGAAHAK